MEAFIGTIILFAGNFAPRGWAFCHGQLLAVQQNAALFSVLGTTYGGNGHSTFALPDLRGRVPVGQGEGLGLSNYALGEAGGVENVSIVGAVGTAPGEQPALAAHAPPHSNVQPYLGLNYIIALEGLYPTRE